MASKKSRSSWSGIGRRVQHVRKQLNLTTLEMADMLALSYTSYNRNERGVTIPGKDSLIKFVTRYGISLNWLFFNHGPMYLEKIDQALKTLEEKDLPPGERASSPEEIEKLQNARSWEYLAPDIRDLLDHMEQDPLMRYEVLVTFQKYKIQKKSQAGN